MPPSFVVAKAYLDQLVRSKAMAADKAKALASQMDAAEKASGRNRTNALDQLAKLTAQAESDGAKLVDRDAMRLKGMADAVKARSVQLR